MQKLHLVGFTTDQNGLILAARRGARSGGYTLVLDDALAQAVDDLRARQEEEAEAAGRSGGGNRIESKLPIGEIQTRLRRGRSVKDVAKDAGVDQEWVERFAAPVFAEQAEVISRVQGTFYKRQRLGPSGLRIGDAVRRNLAERQVVMSPAEYAEAWKTFQRPDGRWIVTFAFHYRGSARTLKFEVRPNGDVLGNDQLTGQMAYITPPKRSAPRPKPPAPSGPVDATAKRAVVSSGFRPDPPVKAASRPGKERERAAAAMTKAAARRAVEGEKAAARKAREREQMLARRAREAAVEAQRRQREIAAKSREAAAAARLAAAEQAERDRAAQAVAAARAADREAARRAARLKVKAQSKAVAARKVAAGRAEKATTAKAAAAVRAADGRPAPRKPPRPKADARVEAPPPPRAERAPKAASPVKAARPASPARSARPAPTPAATPAKARPPRVEADPTPVPRPRPSIGDLAREVRGDTAPRPQFRTGLATPAADGDEPTMAVPAARRPAADANGTAPTRPPGARRTRPLRAT